MFLHRNYLLVFCHRQAEHLQNLHFVLHVGRLFLQNILMANYLIMKLLKASLQKIRQNISVRS